MILDLRARPTSSLYHYEEQIRVDEELTETREKETDTSALNLKEEEFTQDMIIYIPCLSMSQQRAHGKGINPRNGDKETERNKNQKSCNNPVQDRDKKPKGTKVINHATIRSKIELVRIRCRRNKPCVRL